MSVEATDILGRTWPAVRARAVAFAADPPPDAVAVLAGLFARPEWEPRFFAVCALGPLAGRDPTALALLRDIADSDVDWQINEGLAFAFDDYCAGIGYEQALPEIRSWLGAASPNRRRAVSEGLRRWTDARRPYFHENPDEAVALLGTLRADPSPYVQKSVGNAMRDIWRAHPDLVVAAIRAWTAEDPTAKGRRTMAKLALKQAVVDEPGLESLWTAGA
jgi:hypothetical protein